MCVCVRERERERERDRARERERASDRASERERESEQDLRTGNVATDMQINADITTKGAMFIHIQGGTVASSQRLHLQLLKQSIN